MSRILFFAICAVGYAQDMDVTFTPRQMKEWNEQGADGRCIIRVVVDDEADIELRGNEVRIRVLRGGAGKDDGSECTQWLPLGGFTRFSWRGIDGRGEVRMVQEPRIGNDSTAIVAIKDSRRGAEGYTFEFSWTTDGSALWTPNAARISGNTRRRTGGVGGYRPQARPFTGVNETPSGRGQISLGNRSDQVQRMRVNLRNDGGFDLSVYSSVVTSLSGRWTSNQPDTADLQISGFGLGEATGSGRVYVRDGHVTRIEFQGRTAQDPFSVTFDTQGETPVRKGGILPELNPKNE
jgi:hypothetical protein